MMKALLCHLPRASYCAHSAAAANFRLAVPLNAHSHTYGHHASAEESILSFCFITSALNAIVLSHCDCLGCLFFSDGRESCYSFRGNGCQTAVQTGIGAHPLFEPVEIKDGRFSRAHLSHTFPTLVSTSSTGAGDHNPPLAAAAATPPVRHGSLTGWKRETAIKKISIKKY